LFKVGKEETGPGSGVSWKSADCRRGVGMAGRQQLSFRRAEATVSTGLKNMKFTHYDDIALAKKRFTN